MIKCPKCGSKTKVTDSRCKKENTVKRRKRVCLDCLNAFWTTEEVIVKVPTRLIIIKRSNSHRNLLKIATESSSINKSSIETTAIMKTTIKSLEMISKHAKKANLTFSIKKEDNKPSAIVIGPHEFNVIENVMAMCR